LKKIIFCMSFLVSLLAGIFNAGSQEYFKGKSIRLLIGTSTGGAMEAMRRVAKVLLSSGDLGRPFIAHQGCLRTASKFCARLSARP
jgi:hypothetical protein